MIEECIDVAAQAPTGRNREAWRFLVVSDPERKAALGQLYRQAFERYRSLAQEQARASGSPAEAPRPAQRSLAESLAQFPVLIVACIEGRPDPHSVAQQVALYGSILPAAWSLMLALRARGIGATWTSLHLLREEEAAQALGIPPDATQTVLLPIGYMRDAVLRPAERLPPDQITYWNRWGNSRPPERGPTGP